MKMWRIIFTSVVKQTIAFCFGDCFRGAREVELDTEAMGVKEIYLKELKKKKKS